MVSGLSSLWVIVDKKEIAAITTAAFTRHGSAESGAKAMMFVIHHASWVNPRILHHGSLGGLRSMSGRGRAACPTFEYIMQGNANQRE